MPGWPGKRLTRTDRADRYTLPLTAYPESFQQDVDRYCDQLRGQDLEDIFSDDLLDKAKHPRRRHRPLRPASIEAGRWMIRCAAAALVLTGIEPDQITSLHDLVDPLDRPKAIIRFYLERRDGQSSHLAERIARTLLLIARDYCQLPDDHVTQIAAWVARIELPKQTGLTVKNAARLRALMQPRARAMLLCLPAELMRRAAAPNKKPEEAARYALYATALEILLICPMRRGNLGGLRLDRHLHRPDPRKRKITHIIIEGDETKNGNPIHWPLPPESGKLIETFLTRYRHHLVDPGNPFLFGSRDRRRSAQHLGEHLSQIITREIGVEFNVHLARHFAAWNFLRQNPGQDEVVRQVLGHCSIATTINYYVGLEAAASALHFDATVLRDRQAVRRIAAIAFRKGSGALRREGRRVPK